MKLIMFMFLGSAIIEILLKNIFPADQNTVDPKAALEKLEQQQFHEAGLPNEHSEESYSYISSEAGPHGVQIHDVSEGADLNVEEKQE